MLNEMSLLSYLFIYPPVKGCDEDCGYVLQAYAQPDSKFRPDVIVQRIIKDKLEIFAITKETIIYFFRLLSQVNVLKF